MEELVAVSESCKAWIEVSRSSSSPFPVSPTWKGFHSPILLSNRVEGRFVGLGPISGSSWVVREVVAVGRGRGHQWVLQRLDRGKLFFYLFFDLFIGSGFGFSLSLGFVANEKICFSMVVVVVVNPYEWGFLDLTVSVNLKYWN